MADQKSVSQVADIIDRALSQGQSSLSEFDSKKILAAYGLPISREELAGDAAEAVEAAGRLGYPVAVKANAPGLAHKTERGLVKLNLADAEQVKAAVRDLAAELGDEPAGFLVQEMVSGDREFVLGLNRDPLFGPAVMFGLGGVFTEALAQVAFRTAPLDRTQAREMLHETRAGKLLGPIRGMKPVDEDQLCQAVLSLGQLGLDHPRVKAIDLNPVIVSHGRITAVDALVILEEPPPEPSRRLASPEELTLLFKPKSVVVIGASATPGKPGNDVINNILANEFKGDLYLVNPKGGQIKGLDVLTSIADLPSGIDQGIIILPAKATPQTIRDCAAKGIKSLVLAAGGFAEVDESGEELQEETIRAIKETGVRAIGPNTSGHSSLPHNYTSSFFPLGKMPVGRISYIAQTGNFATHTMRYIMSGENFGPARVCGMGNKLDLDECDFLNYLGDDPATEAIFVYLESIKRPRMFLDLAAEVTRRKPVVLLKGGATSQGAAAAQAHTAALAADDKLVDAALKQAGVVRVREYSHLILAAKAMNMCPLPQGNRVGFLAPSGAILVCLTDLCHHSLDLQVPKVSEKTRARLQEISPPFIRMRNPVDIWGSAGMIGVEAGYREGMKALLEDPNIDAVVPVMMLTDETGVPDMNFIVDLAKAYPDKPIITTFSGQKKHMDATKALLEPQGLPTYPLIEEPFEVLNIMAKCRRAMTRP